MYGHVITKFPQMGRLPYFLSYGAPATRRAWSSAITTQRILLEKKKQIGLSVKDRKKLKRVVKACS